MKKYVYYCFFAVATVVLYIIERIFLGFNWVVINPIIILLTNICLILPEPKTCDIDEKTGKAQYKVNAIMGLDEVQFQVNLAVVWIFQKRIYCAAQMTLYGEEF